MNNNINISEDNSSSEWSQQYDEPTYYEYERNGFVTFWLWLGIISSIFSGIYGAFTSSSFSNLGSYGAQLIAVGIDFSHAASQLENASLILTVSTILSAIGCLTGYILLLNWRKAGYWVIVASSFILSCINFYAMSLITEACSEIGLYIKFVVSPIVGAVGSILSWIILWAILQIRKNGVSCWRQLY